MPRIDRAIARLAERQHGLITRHQLSELGAGDTFAYHRTRSGKWSLVSRGVFRVGGAPITFHQRCMAAVLAAGPGALLSHRTALRLWEAAPRSAVPLEVSVPRGRQHRQAGVITHTSRDIALARPVIRHRIPTTGLARTLLDLGAVDPTGVRGAVWLARRTHGLGWDTMLQALVEHGKHGRSGVGPLRQVVAEHYGELSRDSATEDLAFRILDDSPIPRPATQIPVMCADGVEVTVDLGWPNFGAYLEIHGVDHLTNEDLQHLDLHRRNQIELAGHRLLIYSGRLLRRQPDQFVHDVAAMLRSQGWSPPQGNWL